MSTYSINLPSYTIGVAAYEQIQEVCPTYGTKVVAIGGKTAISKAKDLICSAIKDSELRVLDFVWYGGEASYENMEALKVLQSVREADMIFAIGGGKVMDTCKLLARALHKPLFTFPTIASNCACLTALSVVYYPDGTFRELNVSDIPPVHVFIHTQIAVEAPKQFLWAGMGDTIAKYYESNLAARNVELEHFNAVGVQLSRLCANPILEYGMKALKDNENHVLSKEFEQVVLAIVVSTGLVSNFVESDYNGHIAHAFYCTITMLPQIEEKHLHGEVVAYGVLLLLMCDGQEKELAKVFSFCRDLGLPTCLADLDVTLAELDGVFDETVKSGELTRSPYLVTKEMLYTGVLKLEEYHEKNCR
ncbi:iron-containing alcohol dehydrogenase family protein [Anaerosinus sp.]|uniref:iron-containing alcohol dehydrogenase family protein n=1 Tax=Selenobaculum sp. TaxID=3074374 RepID=UPI0015AEB27B